MAAGVGDKQRWLGKGVEPDLSEAVDVTVDGDIWVGLKDGTVRRFRRGANENFKMTGLAEPIGELTAIYTDENSNQVYVLDRLRTRVVVFDKEGTYKKQYGWSGISGVTDMAVSEKDGQIFLLSGASIYAMPL